MKTRSLNTVNCRKSCIKLWRLMHGMEIGIVVHITTMVHLWDLLKTANARSIPSLNRGLSYLKQPTVRPSPPRSRQSLSTKPPCVQYRRWSPSLSDLCDLMINLCCSLPHLSMRHPAIPATSRAIRQVSVRMGVNTHTLRFGLLGRLLNWGRGIEPKHCSGCLTPFTIAIHRKRLPVTRWSLT